MEYTINNRKINVRIDGETAHGEEIILLHKDDNLIKETIWANEGFTISGFLDELENEKLLNGIRKLLSIILGSLNIHLPENFNPEKLHEMPGLDEELYSRLMQKTSFFPTNILPVDAKVFTDRLSEICHAPLTIKNPFTQLELFHIRIVRPNSNDNNPLHRDVWLDRLRNAVNIYLPLFGSNELSSLCIVPESHLWMESEIERTAEGALVNGKPFTVPAVTGSKRKMDFFRPDPKNGEVLVFSPYLIHGGAMNFNPDQTRMSLEMRLWRAK